MTTKQPNLQLCPTCNAPLCGCEADEAGITHYGCKHFPDAHDGDMCVRCEGESTKNDSTGEILKEFAPLVDDVTDPFYEEDSSVYEMLKANIFMVLHKALTRQREAIEAEHNAIDKAAQESTAEQWEKIKEGIRKEEREELVKSLRMEKENLYEPERKKGKWDWRVQREEGYNEAVDKFNAKLDELK